MPNSDAFRYIMNLPGSRPVASYSRPQGQGTSAIAPTQQVQQFNNQQVGALNAGTSAQIGPSATPQALQQPVVNTATITSGTKSAVRENSQRMLQTALIARQQRRAAAANLQRMQAAANPQRTARPVAPRAPAPSGGGGGGGGGTAEARIRGLLGRYPGLHITETLGNRAYDVAHGVDRVPGSYHYDRNNPAVDIAGPISQLHKLYAELVAEGHWRQILWQVPGHYDHLHVA